MTESREPELRELVSSSTGQILDCDLSYDGKTVLFNWRRVKEEGYHVWRIDVDGPRPCTTLDRCVPFLYLSPCKTNITTYVTWLEKGSVMAREDRDELDDLLIDLEAFS